jgi:hypothetical protein
VLSGAVAAAAVGWIWTQAGRAAAPSATTISGRGVQNVQYIRETEPSLTQNTDFVDIPEAVATVAVPSGRRAVVLIRLTGVVTCNGGADFCLVQATVDGIPAEPSGPIGIVLANTDDPGPDTRSFEGSAALTAGMHTVKAQWAVTSEAAQFTIHNWHLTVEVTLSS